MSLKGHVLVVDPYFLPKNIYCYTEPQPVEIYGGEQGL